jgi:hypothetical protein
MVIGFLIILGLALWFNYRAHRFDDHMDKIVDDWYREEIKKKK